MPNARIRLVVLFLNCIWCPSANSQYAVPLMDTERCNPSRCCCFDGPNCAEFGHPTCRPTYYFNHAPPGSVLDYGCRQRTYYRTNGSYSHSGTDIGTPATLDPVVRAAANGRVIRRFDRCTVDNCGTGDCDCDNRTADRFWAGNFVEILDIFGRRVIYAHLESERPPLGVSPAVEGVPDQVQVDSVVVCGQTLGRAASSGWSAGPHLHFQVEERIAEEWVPIDPYAGRCTEQRSRSEAPILPISLWMDQGDYGNLPSTRCYECSHAPGQMVRDPLYPASDSDERISRPASRAVLKAYNLSPLDVSRTRGASTQRPSLGCPGADANSSSPYLRQTPGPDAPVWIQQFYQGDFLRRFEGSAGDTAVIYNDRLQQSSITDNAYLLRSGFWGAYKCLKLATMVRSSVEFGGALALGPPTSDEWTDRGITRQNFQFGYMTWQPSEGLARVHINAHGQPNGHPWIEDPHSEIDWPATLAACQPAAIRVVSNPPVAPMCGGEPEVCDGKDNSGNGQADEGCPAVRANQIRIHYQAPECADSIELVGDTRDAAGNLLSAFWDGSAQCRQTNTAAIVCDLPADATQTQYLRFNLVSGIDGRPWSACENGSLFGQARVTWNGRDIEGSCLADGEFGPFIEVLLPGGTPNVCGDSICIGTENRSSCPTDCLCEPGDDRCNQGNIYSCRSDGRSESRFPCADGFCDGDSCGLCDNTCLGVGQSECVNGQIRSCLADPQGCSQWDSNWEPCTTGRCEIAGRACGACVDQCSQVGLSECRGGQIRACVPGGSGCAVWSSWSTCPTSTCQTNGLRCTSPGCAGDVECSLTEYCRAGQCLLDVCLADQDFCAGSILSHCTPRGESIVAIQSCEHGCAGGACRVQCQVDLDCPPHKHCNAVAGRCAYDTCAQGQGFCQSGTLMACFANGAGSRRVETCADQCESGQCCGTLGEPCCWGSHCSMPLVCATGICGLQPTRPDAGAPGSPDAGPVPPTRDSGTIRCSPIAALARNGESVQGVTAGPSLLSQGCGGAMSPETIYTWTPLVSGRATIETCGSGFDTVLSVRAARCDGPELACADDVCGNQSRLSLPVVAGQTYAIIVDGDGASGAFTLRVIAPSLGPVDAGVGQPPSAPQRVTALYEQGAASNIISWSAVPNATSYRVYWANSPGLVRGGPALVSTTQLFIGQVSPILGATYYYRVAAINSAGEGPLSVEVIVAVPSPGSPVVSVSPSRGDHGTVFSEPGTGFSANGIVTLHFWDPSGTTSQRVVSADANGRFQYSYQVHSGTVPGRWRYWAVDSTSGQISNTVSFTVGEVCNGLDDDGNTIIDDPGGCWLMIHRWRTNNGWPLEARCLGVSATSPPSQCSGYVHERDAFIVSAFGVPGTFEARQCSNGYDHLLLDAASPEFQSLSVSPGWDCSVSLGYPFLRNSAPTAAETSWDYVCPLYRFQYGNGGTSSSHLYTIGSDLLSNLNCEGSRAHVFMDGVAASYCFGQRPTGCLW